MKLSTIFPMSRLAVCSAIVLTAFGSVACNTSDDDAFRKGGAVEMKPAGLGAVDSADANAPAKPVVKATYDLKILTRSGVRLCNGNVDINIMSDMKIDLPVAEVRCLALKLDLGKLLKQTTVDEANKPKLEADRGMLKIDRMGEAVFTPKRPLILGPVIQDTSIYRNFTDEGDYSVVVKDAATGDEKSGSGRIRVAVLAIDSKFPTEKYPNEFDRVLHWEMTSSGFDGVPVAKAFLFDKVEFYWNVNPIMIPKIVIHGSLKDFISGSLVGGGAGGGGAGGGGAGGGGMGDILGNIGDAIIGKLRVEITVNSFERL